MWFRQGRQSQAKGERHEQQVDQRPRGKAPVPGLSSRARAAAQGAGESSPGARGEARGDLVSLITQLTEQMHAAAAELQFEAAARLRDEIRELKRELRGMEAAGV